MRDSSEVIELPGGQSALALGRFLCIVSVIFASGDIWPVVHLGFTFRLAQLCIYAAALFILANRNYSIKLFPGLVGLYAFCTWIAISLPFSLFLQRSIGYVVWTLSDALIIFVFVQYFRTETAVLNLFRWTMLAYATISMFGFLQFVLYTRGINVFVTEWWVKGRIARINGLSYEPSYFATYLMAGWVTCMYLFEKNAPFPNRRLQRICLFVVTGALLLCSSRMGYAMMFLWVVFRISLRAMRAAISGVATRGGFRVAVAAIFGSLLAGLSVWHYWRSVLTVASAVPFLFSGLGLMGHSAQSAHTRLESLSRTWVAFTQHPIVGTGIGALPVAIASQNGIGVYDLEQAKKYEGMSIGMEVLAETGLIGAALLTAAIVRILQRYWNARRNAPDWQRIMLSAQAWGLAWMLIMLQMNQNFLRIYIYVDLAVLICMIGMEPDVDSLGGASLS
jgi:hypothetical protein